MDVYFLLIFTGGFTIISLIFPHIFFHCLFLAHVREREKKNSVLNVWDSGNYTAGRDDDEGGTAGWTELGPLLDAHSWGGRREHSRPKVCFCQKRKKKKKKKQWHASFLFYFIFFLSPSRIPFPSPYRPPSIPSMLRINYGAPNKCPPFGSSFSLTPSFFHYIRLAIIL